MLVMLVVLIGTCALGALVVQRGRRAWVLALASLTAIPWGLFVAYYAHVVDHALYFEWRSQQSADALAGAIGFFVGAIMRPVVDKRLVIAHVVGSVLALAALFVIAYAKPLVNPMPASAIRNQWRDDVCLQSTPATCGPCAAATVLRSLGIDVDERTLAHEAASTRSGTLNWLLIRALRARGVEARFLEPASFDDVTPPAIVGVRSGVVGHFIALLDRKPDGQMVIGEPLSGRIVGDRAALERQYTFDHFAIEIRR